KQFPEAWTIVLPEFPEIRSIYTKRFRHKVFYRIDPDAVYVLAVAHGTRKPLYWLDRLNS
ncbi:MAG: hypothetical protein JXR78_10530, partial [Victivallales bacterium]|nr:hypothetical protein [Victivallales bacterium]